MESHSVAAVSRRPASGLGIPLDVATGSHARAVMLLVVFCLIAFPAAYMGTSVDWFGQMLTYTEIMGAAAIVLLVPYCALRSVVPPLSGFGGY